MKKLRKAGVFVLSFLLGTGIFAQTNVYAKGNPGRSQGKSKVHAAKAHAAKVHENVKNSTEKTVPYGLAKKAVPPVIKQGGVLIPVNAVVKSLGADVAWDSENQVVTITKDGTTIIINLVSKTATVNGAEVALPTAVVAEIDPVLPVDAVAGTDTTVSTDVIAGTDTVSEDVVEGTDADLTTDVTDGSEMTSDVKSISKNGTVVLLNFIAENLGADLDATTEEQIVDEALKEAATQTTDSEAATTESTPTTNTDVQASVDLQN